MNFGYHNRPTLVPVSSRVALIPGRYYCTHLPSLIQSTSHRHIFVIHTVLSSHVRRGVHKGGSGEPRPPPPSRRSRPSANFVLNKLFLSAFFCLCRHILAFGGIFPFLVGIFPFLVSKFMARPPLENGLINNNNNLIYGIVDRKVIARLATVT